MQTVAPLKKNKINLSDYNYQNDIELRSFMAEFSVLEVNILSEIVHGSLKIKIAQMAEYLEVSSSALMGCLDKLQKTKLYQIENGHILVNKEMRKYWENQIPKFSDNFCPDMEFLRDLLGKVPIHALPNWYSISRCSDDIFYSIIEKYFLTPKIYNHYLRELYFEEPVLGNIMKDVFEAPDFTLDAQTLINKYALPREKFEELMLLLEFNLVCCLSYNQSGDKWIEVITPFHEWAQYLRFKRDTAPQAIEETSQIIRNYSHDFEFVNDLTFLSQQVAKKPKEVIPDQLFCSKDEKYLSKVIDKALKLKLIEIEENILTPGKSFLEWEEKPLQERALTLYRNAVSQNHFGYIDKDLKETEKALKKIATKGWIYFDDFIKACTAPIGNHGATILKKTGKRWKYHLPQYSEEDIAKFHHYIFETLFQSGITAIGSLNGKPCFYLTSFGRMTID